MFSIPDGLWQVSWYLKQNHSHRLLQILQLSPDLHRPTHTHWLQQDQGANKPEKRGQRSYGTHWLQISSLLLSLYVWMTKRCTCSCRCDWELFRSMYVTMWCLLGSPLDNMGGYTDWTENTSIIQKMKCNTGQKVKSSKIFLFLSFLF